MFLRIKFSLVFHSSKVKSKIDGEWINYTTEKIRNKYKKMRVNIETEKGTDNTTIEVVEQKLRLAKANAELIEILEEQQIQQLQLQIQQKRVKQTKAAVTQSHIKSQLNQIIQKKTAMHQNSREL